MKIKSAYKYQISELKKPVIIYYAIIVAMMAAAAIIMAVFKNSVIHIESFDNPYSMATVIFLFVCGLNSFRQQFHMFLANGLSRKTLFLSTLAAFATASVAMAVIDGILDMAASLYLSGNLPTQFVDAFVWSVFCYMAAAVTGIFITTAYYRMNKAVKLLVSIGVPVMVFIVIPIVDYTFFNGVITTGFYRFISAATSLLGEDNPYSMVLVNIFNVAIFSGLSWMLTRRAIVKA